MDNELIVTNERVGALYMKMQTAIVECFTVDDCKQIAVQANAIAAYYSQINDDESVRKFIQIKLRAWRRIGEILMSAGVDRMECLNEDGRVNNAEYIRRIRSKFSGHKDVEELSDSSFRQAIKVAEIPEDFFDDNVGQHNSIGSLFNAFMDMQRQEWETSPEGQDELAIRKAEEVEWQKKLAAEEKIRRKENEQRQKEDAAAVLLRDREEADLRRLKEARDQAFSEVGITLDRRDRERMHQIVFLLKKNIYEILRRASFDNRQTMQSILRSGLMMWFIAHGYYVSAEDLSLPGKRTPKT